MITKSISNNIAYKKHKGFVIVLALVVVAVGLLIITFMFNSVSSFTRYFSEYRRAYVDTVTARKYIELVKGDLVAANNARGAAGDSVLHGLENQDPSFPAGAIPDLRGLLILSNNEGRFEIDDPININGPQRVEVRVYDANYDVNGLVDPFPDVNELPPSFFVQGGSVRDWTEIGDSGRDYNKFDEDGSGKGNHSDYGAYIIRVKIYNTANNAERLVRTTEEAFLQVIR